MTRQRMRIINLEQLTFSVLKDRSMTYSGKNMKKAELMCAIFAIS